MPFWHGNDEPALPDPVFDEDQDLSEIWPQVVREYEDTTKMKLDTKTTFKSFKLQIEAEIKESATRSHNNARTVLSNIANCLEKFGSLVAQGGSVVFGPTAQCWNAISFVIQAVRGFSEMMEGFVTLMERSAAFLGRLVNFMQQNVGKDGSHLPRSVRKPAYGVLSQFLRVLRSSYKLATSKTERAKAMTKVFLFSSDNQVAESLKLMEDTIKEFTRAEIDEILLDVKGLARHLDKSDEERVRFQTEIDDHFEKIYKVSDQVLSVTQQMKTTLDGRATKEKQDKNLEKIANSLGLKKAGDWETWRKRHSDLCKTQVQGTGEWLSRDEPKFIKWADLDQHDSEVLFLKADSGFGKTHLFNYGVSHLEKKCRAPRGPNQTYLAYYYYGDDKDDSFERCIGSIIYQFAAADVGYAQAVANECEQLASIARAKERWNTLVSGLLHAMKGIYFICMDGFDGLGQLDTAGVMMSTIAPHATSSVKSNGVSLRLFISGSEDALSEIAQNAANIQTIALGPRTDSVRYTERTDDGPNTAPPSERLPNASDLEAVTRARIEDVCKNKPDLKAILNESNIELLLTGIRGNYKNLEAKITEINACDTKGKVQDVINNTNADMKIVQKDRVRKLDAFLSSRQAEVLNELLVWVAGLSYEPSIKLLESVLFLTLKEEFLLADQIKTIYSPVLEAKEDRVGFRDGLKDILTASNTDSTLSQLHTEAISGAEVNLCRRFIKNACDPTDYARFKFDHFFNAMEQKVHIHLDGENDVNVTILDKCVDALFDSREDENLEQLRDYASKEFYSHLKVLVEALDTEFEPSKRFLSDIGSKLVDLIHDPKKIDTWFLKKNLIKLKYDLLYQEDFVDPLLKFLKNSQVAKGYTRNPEKNKWVKSVISDTASKYSILERVAARLASHWFSCSTGTTEREYLWISYGIVSKIFDPETPFDDWNSPDLTEVHKFIRWAKEHVDMNIDSVTWDFCIGVTYIVFDYHKEAIVALEKVEQHFQTNWCLFFNLALAHKNEKNYRTALKYIQDFKSLSNLFLETDDSYKTAYWDLLLAEGNCHRQCQDYYLAVESFQDLLGQKIDEKSDSKWIHLGALGRLFTVWTEMKSYQSIIEFVRKWKDVTSHVCGSTYWLRKASFFDGVHTGIIVAAKNARAVEETILLYQEAIDYKSSDPSMVDEDGVDQQGVDISPEVTEQLQYFQAVLRFHGSNSRHDQHRGIQCWEDIVRRSDENPALFWTARTASLRLAPTLLDEAIAEPPTTPSSSSGNFVSRLETFANLNTTIVCSLRQGYFDPRLCLARLYCLKNDHAAAFVQAQARLCSVFDKWPAATDDNSLSLRFSNLAQTLTVLDKDVDAVAAWQAIKPYQLPLASTTDGEISTGRKLEKPSSGVSHTNGVTGTLDKKLEESPVMSPLATTTTKAYLSGYSCDGDCDTEWKDLLADCFMCKHCLCVQFCRRCYEKLLTNDMRPLICNKDHKMLYLPPFDWNAWRVIPADMMTVGKQLVPRHEWIDRIRREYNVEQSEIDSIKITKAIRLKAASVIAVQWRNRLQRKRARKPSMALALRRIKTVG